MKPPSLQLLPNNHFLKFEKKPHQSLFWRIAPSGLQGNKNGSHRHPNDHHLIIGGIPLAVDTKAALNIDGRPLCELINGNSVDNNDLIFIGYGSTGELNNDWGILRKGMSSLSHAERVADDTLKVQSVVCNGDSGGPSLIRSQGQLKIFSVNSSVSGHSADICRENNYIKDVRYFVPWIEKTLKTSER